MSSSTRDVADVPDSPAIAGGRLAELLSVIAEAPDYQTAAQFIVAQLAEVAGAQRACLMSLDRTNLTLGVTACVGFAESERPRVVIPAEDETHPLVATTLGLVSIVCDGSAPTRLGLPFEKWLAVPLPQPQFRGALSVLSERRISEMSLKGCALHLASTGERGRRIGHVPFGVIVVETTPTPELVSMMSYAAMLAGPLLSRMAALEAYRSTAEGLDQQRSLLTALIDSIPDPIVITDASNDIVVQNRRAEHLLQMSETDSEGRRRAVEINNLLFTSFLSRAVMAGGVQSGARELNLVDPDEGADLLFEVLAHPLPSAVAPEGSYVSVLRDVTDLRRAAGELERQVQRVRLAEIDATRERDRLNLILENVADPILVTDDRSNIILMNRQAEKLFQIDEGAPPDRNRTAAVRGNDTKFTTFVADFTISPAAARHEQMQLTEPQSAIEFPVEVVSGKIMNQRGEPEVIVSALHDLTKQVENERLFEELKKFSSELEQRIRAATADLAAQNARLQWQARELEKANRLKSDFLASMSHELRTPINALIGYTALLLDRIYGEINANQEEGLRRIRASAEHLLTLINDILDLAKIEAGKMPLHLEDVPLSEILSEITQQIEPLIRKKALEFTCDLPRSGPVMHTDRTKVKQILLNLLSNAVKFTHRGRIMIAVVPEHTSSVRIDVIDTGIGIRTQDLEAIWEDFRQVDQSRTREFGGTGLGLSITRKLIDALGGEAWVQSEYGKGSTFSVRLPVRTVPRPQGPDESNRTPPRGMSAIGD